MSLERLAAGVVLPGFPGHEAPSWLLTWLERGLGGVVLFAWNVGGEEQLARLTALLRDVRPEALIAIDEEGGDVTRLDAAEGGSTPGNLALGAVDDPALTRAVAASIAARLARAGVNLNLAPVADANTNPRNPVIGVRSFGADPELVARHVAAFVEGTQSAGVAACAKHFPGHGDTREDSHLALPVVDALPDQAPFRAAVDAGVRAMMTAHIVVRELADEPATISPAVLGLLRDELGFDGLVVSDALEMAGLASFAGVEEGAVRALAAGVDALCLGHDLHEEAVEGVCSAVAAAVRQGRLAEERLAEAAGRVASVGVPPGGGTVDGSVGATAARRAVRASRDVRLAAPPFVVELVAEPSIAAGPAAYGFGDAVRERWPDAPVELVAEGGGLPPLPEGPVVLVQRDADRHAWQQALAAELRAERPDAVVVETGLPGDADVLTYGAARVNLQAAVELLAG